MNGPDRSKFKTRKKRREPSRSPEPVRILSPAEKAALLASRPDLQPPRSRAREKDVER